MENSCSDTGLAESLIHLINEIACIAGFADPFRKDSTYLCRRVSLLSHLIEEIREFTANLGCSISSSLSSPSPSYLSDLAFALQNVKSLLLISRTFDSKEDAAVKKLASQFQCVMLNLDKALSSIPYNDIGISEDVQEQVELVRMQLKRAIERYGPVNSSVLSRTLSLPLDKKVYRPQAISKLMSSLNIDSTQVVTESENKLSRETEEEIKKSDSVTIPEDFLCSISLEIMRDPVIVATGQTYERSYIQRWIDSGNLTCPKTQQKLQNFTLTPNYVLRSLISRWCIKNNVEPPTALVSGKLKKSDGSFRDVSGDIAAIQSLVLKLSNRCVQECRESVKEIRFLSKRNTDNRILIAEAGAIPVLVNLLTPNDVLTQENAVTAILNLSIYDSNKQLIMLSGAIPSIVQVLRNGSMEARENAAATLFSLSLADENKIIIGSTGAIPALVELLQCGSPRGRKDVSVALFNLCIYQGNKGRAVRAGIIAALFKMLTESNRAMVDESLTLLAVVVAHPDAKVEMAKAGMIPVLVDLMSTSSPRNKENAAATLLALCKRDEEKLGCLVSLDAAVALTELAKSGTERAQRKATSLLELLRRMLQQ